MTGRKAVKDMKRKSNQILTLIIPEQFYRPFGCPVKISRHWIKTFTRYTTIPNSNSIPKETEFKRLETITWS